jgi:C4-type Zn-finger protein
MHDSGENNIPRLSSIDYTGLTSPYCPVCGDLKFKTWIAVDSETFEIQIYGSDGECWECGTKYTIVVPQEKEAKND